MRHEIKYLIRTADIPAISDRLSSIMSVDSHANSWGGYSIRSLYFDDAYKSAYNDKLAGVSNRVKYRIRSYEGDLNALYFEAKRKYGDVVEKNVSKISPRIAKRLMQGDASGLYASDDKLLRELYARVTTDILRPVVIVDYDRIAYVHAGGNTRVTIDRNVKSGLGNINMFDAGILTVDAMPPEESILEVKYDGMLPDFISVALSCFPSARSAISKYVMCARFVI